MANEILEVMEFDPERGALSFRGTRYLLIRPETLAGIGADPAALERGGAEGGSRAAARLAAEGAAPQEVVSRMCAMGTRLGWGRMRLVEFGHDGFVVEVASSPFVEGGTCALVRGVFRGVGEVIFGTACRAEETACAAREGEACRFSIHLREGYV